jgi:protein TonB
MSQQFSRAQRSDASVFPAPSYSWGAPGKTLTVRLPFDLIDRLERLVVENFRSIDALGSEIGGLLFGGMDPAEPTHLQIEDFETIPCDYSRGPFYRLADADLARFDAAIAKRGGAAIAGGARVAGFFRSHSRKGLALDAEDLKLMEARFSGPSQVALLVRPFATKVSAAGIFIWEDGRMRGEASYLEFPFRSTELKAADGATGPDVAAAGKADGPAPGPKPVTRAAVVPMPSRPKPARPSTPTAVSGQSAPPSPPAADPPAMPAAKTEEPGSVDAGEPAKPSEPVDSPMLAEPESGPSESIAETKTVETDAPAGPFARVPRGKLLKLAIAAALVACSGALFLHSGLFRRAPRPPAALTLRIERTATDLLLTWNRDSDAVRNAKKAVLSISDGDRQENLDLNLSDLRNGSIVYSPLSTDVSFRMEVTGPDQSKTASESVRVLRTKPSPMPDADAAPPTKHDSTQRAAAPVAPTSPAEQPAAAEAAPADPAPAPKRSPIATFNAASLAQRLRPALPTDLPVAPVLTATPDSAAPVNLGALAPGTSSVVSRPAAPPEAKTTPKATDIRQPQLITRVNPAYPDLARRQRVSGIVSLAVTIGPDGKVVSVQALSGPELLRGPAIEAVKQWVYSPMTMNGRAVEAEKQIDLNFTMNR